MSETLPPPLDFDTLRTIGIRAAQDASGDHWSDYNLHDPGVTLLEQTVFALTEIAYQADHKVRDLLTRPDGQFDPAELALFAPKEVLPGRPITLVDLAECLSDIPEVERVFVRKGPTPGLIDLTVIPRQQVNPSNSEDTTSDRAGLDAIDATRQTFERVRLLGTDLSRLLLARAHPVQLTGIITLSAFADPNRIVAQIHAEARQFLHGLNAENSRLEQFSGATREDVFDNPASVWPQLAADAAQTTQVETLIGALRDIDGIEAITGLQVLDPETGLPPTRLATRPDIYLDPVLPTPDHPSQLIIQIEETPVTLNAHAINDEFDRIQTARIASRGNRTDKRDWDVMRPGKPRSFARPETGATLPQIYHIPTSGRDVFTRYRGIIEAHLDRMSAPVSRLHEIYSQADNIAEIDPKIIRKRRAVLDYLIALHGEEMPSTSRTRLHCYRGLSQRLEWEIAWRETYLANLPHYNRASGSADPEWGFAARLAHLADLTHETKVPDTSTINPCGIKLTQALPLTDQPGATTSESALTIDPRRPALQRSMYLPVLSPDRLKDQHPWLNAGPISTEFFRRAADPSTYKIGQDGDSHWRVMLDAGPGQRKLLDNLHEDYGAAARQGNQLCNTMAALNRQAERFWIVESIKLRSGLFDFAQSKGSILLSGWTRRGMEPAFRNYVERLILRLAPAHLHLEPLWLNYNETVAFIEISNSPSPDEKGSKSDLRQFLNKVRSARGGDQ